jgi:hypothetical protein
MKTTLVFILLSQALSYKLSNTNDSYLKLLQLKYKIPEPSTENLSYYRRTLTPIYTPSASPTSRSYKTEPPKKTPQLNKRASPSPVKSEIQVCVKG